jgi:hypothetical protein
MSSQPFRELPTEAPDSAPDVPQPEPAANNPSGETALPPRNFTIPLEERVRALVTGPPAYMRRKRRIEDLGEAIGQALLDAERATIPDVEAHRIRLGRELARLNELIAVHNRYYPCEANLPLDPQTGALLERGEPWSPLPVATFEDLLASARARST